MQKQKGKATKTNNVTRAGVAKHAKHDARGEYYKTHDRRREVREKRQAKYSNAATNRPTTAVMKHNFSGFLLFRKAAK